MGLPFESGYAATGFLPGRVAWIGGGVAAAAPAGVFQAHSRFAVTVLEGMPALAVPQEIGRRFDILLVAPETLSNDACSEWLIGTGLPVVVVGAWPEENIACSTGFYRFDGGLPVDATSFDALDQRIGEVLVEAGMDLHARVVSKDAARNILILVAHRPKQDPRLGWMAHAASEGLRVHQLGVHSPQSNQRVEMAHDACGGLVLSVPMVAYRQGEAVLWGGRCGSDAGAQAAVGQLLWMERLLTMPDAMYLSAVGALGMNGRAVVLRDLLRYFLNTAASLVREGSRLRGVDCIVAADLSTLPAALILGAVFRVKVVYDAHEYWPEADLGSADFEISLWMRLESLLARHAACRFTVSTGLAQLMSENYGLDFQLLPNAEPRRVRRLSPGQAAPADVCVFLFQGGFAQGRGIELLIEAWPSVCAQAHLHLRGPLGEWRERMVELARATGLLERRIFFPLPVDESELVAAAAQAHVGLIPYEPHGANHRHCCPNKLSQYMAAGLPILANDTSFVGGVVRLAGAGLVVDFSSRAALVAAVDCLACDAQTRMAYARNSEGYFASTFHWEAVSAHFYDALNELTANRQAKCLAWFSSGHGLADDVFSCEMGTGQKLGAWVKASLLGIGQVFWGHLPAPAQQRLRPLAERMWRTLQGH